MFHTKQLVTYDMLLVVSYSHTRINWILAARKGWLISVKGTVSSGAWNKSHSGYDCKAIMSTEIYYTVSAQFYYLLLLLPTSCLTCSLISLHGGINRLYNNWRIIFYKYVMRIYLLYSHYIFVEFNRFVKLLINILSLLRCILHKRLLFKLDCFLFSLNQICFKLVWYRSFQSTFRAELYFWTKPLTKLPA